MMGLREGFRHIRGKSVFVGDISLPRMLHCVFIRSSLPHARINNIEKPKDSKIKIFTSDDLKGILNPIEINYNFEGCKRMNLHFMADNYVRFVGEPIAAVLSENMYTAKDYAEIVNVDYEPLPAVTSLFEEKLRVYPHWSDNEFAKISHSFGDPEGALAESDIVVEEKISTHRLAPSPMEARACIASYDNARNSLTIWVTNQNPYMHRAILSEALRIPENKIRVIVPDVGGGFGLKGHTYPEDIVVAALSIATRRPVKWVETRTENLTSSAHSREQIHHIKVGALKNGVLKVLIDDVYLDIGAYLLVPHNNLELAHVVIDALPGPYRINNFKASVHLRVTNKAPTGAYRGFGHPEATFARERVLDILADECGISPVELRVRNLLTSTDIPYIGPTGMVFDSGDPLKAFQMAVDRISSKNVNKVTGERLVGIGYAVGVKGSVPTMIGVTGKWGASEAAAVKLSLDGKVTVYSGAVSIGTGLETVLSKVVAKELNIPPEEVEVFLGDTAITPFSTGLWGSRGVVMCGGAAGIAAKRLKQKILKLASVLLECSPEDLETSNGRVYVKDDQTTAVTFSEIAVKAYNQPYLFQHEDTTLEVVALYDPPNISRTKDEYGRFNASAAVSIAVAASIVWLDRETFKIEKIELVFVENGSEYVDFENAEAQLVGGIIQAIGGTVYEEFIYSAEGHPQTATFAEYLLPTSMETPHIEIMHQIGSSPYTYSGLKGLGETGVIPVGAAIINAIEDALKKGGITKRMKNSSASPYKIWFVVRDD